MARRVGTTYGTLAEAVRIANEFELSPQDVCRVAGHFVKQMKDGLRNHRIWQLPAYVTKIPDGSEEGTFLVVDLGGTNFRICLVTLHGDSTYTVLQSKQAVPVNVRVNKSYKPLFMFIARNIQQFLESHSATLGEDDGKHERLGERPANNYKLGFTFSFSCDQTSLAHGTLIHWDKGWDIPEAVGRDPCQMLQEAIDEISLPVLVCVLANDSVGTLMARSYTSPSKGSTLAGAIFGTGTNAAYVEQLANVERLGKEHQSQEGGSGDVMVINTEWGCFDDDMMVLPTTSYDDILDAKSTDPLSQMLEKRVSGMYLGELLRLVLLRLIEMATFDMAVPVNSSVFERNRIDTSFLSHITGTDNETLDKTKQYMMDILAAQNVSLNDAKAVRLIASAIVRRAARLAGASLAAIIIQSGRLQLAETASGSGTKATVQERQPSDRSSSTSRLAAFVRLSIRQMVKLLSYLGFSWAKKSPPLVESTLPSPAVDEPLEGTGSIIDIGVDGSLVEFSPAFITEIRGALRDVPEIGIVGESKIRIGLAKDGSGVGAALMAQAAMEQTSENSTRGM